MAAVMSLNIFKKEQWIRNSNILDSQTALFRFVKKDLLSFMHIKNIFTFWSELSFCGKIRNYYYFNGCKLLFEQAQFDKIEFNLNGLMS